MVARFFVREALARECVDTSIELPEAVAHHAIRVTRLGVGDTLTLFDGTGGEYVATVTHVDRRTARVRVDAFVPDQRESPLALTLLQAIIAADAMDYAVRRAVELGVHAIVPVITTRSAPLPAGARASRRHAHWQEIVIAACEQCGRNRLPEVHSPTPLQTFAPAAEESWLICAAVPDAVALSAVPARPSRCVIAIGPEGGWTQEEIQHAMRRGATAVHLGPRVLRADTAAVAALAIAQARWGDAR